MASSVLLDEAWHIQVFASDLLESTAGCVSTIREGGSMIKLSWVTVLGCLLLTGCTQESQNQISRSIQNWTGTDGVLDVFSGGKLMYRFIKIDKLTTAQSSAGGQEFRPYRFGYGYLDINQNFEADPGEKKMYFEISDYGTEYVFYENPRT